MKHRVVSGLGLRAVFRLSFRSILIVRSYGGFLAVEALSYGRHEFWKISGGCSI